MSYCGDSTVDGIRVPDSETSIANTRFYSCFIPGATRDERKQKFVERAPDSTDGTGLLSWQEREWKRFVIENPACALDFAGNHHLVRQLGSTMIYETLLHCAADSELWIDSADAESLRLIVEVASRGGERWLVRVPQLVHLDMAPFLTLGSVEFGSLELLPSGDTTLKNLDHGGNIEAYRVIRIRDVDDKLAFIVSYGEESIERLPA